jgi:hypothetical protein
VVGVLFLIELALVHALSFWTLVLANGIALVLMAAEAGVRGAFRL